MSTKPITFPLVVSRDQRRLYKAAARACGMTVFAWMRSVIDHDALTRLGWHYLGPDRWLSPHGSARVTTPQALACESRRLDAQFTAKQPQPDTTE